MPSLAMDYLIFHCRAAKLPRRVKETLEEMKCKYIPLTEVVGVVRRSETSITSTDGVHINLTEVNFTLPFLGGIGRQKAGREDRTRA